MGAGPPSGPGGKGSSDVGRRFFPLFAFHLSVSSLTQN